MNVTRLPELLNRKPARWGNVSVNCFKQDIQLLTDTIQLQNQVIQEILKLCENEEYAILHIAKNIKKIVKEKQVPTLPEVKKNAKGGR